MPNPTFVAFLQHQQIDYTWTLASKGVLVGWAVLLSACQVHQVVTHPSPRVPGEDNAAAIEKKRGRPVGDRLKPWWTSFDDRNLTSWIEEALAENPDVEALSRRIEQANSRIVQAGSTLFPQIDASGGFSRRWDVDGDRRNQASLGWVLDWELDAWGRIRSGRSARIGEREAAIEDWRSARLLLSAAVAEAWFELIEQRGQLALTDEQIEVNSTLLGLTRLRFGQGQGAAVDVLQQQEQLQSTQARVPEIEARIAELELVLDDLAGRLPGARRHRSSGKTLRTPPPLPRRGYPAELLADRPDLRAQRARIVALDYEVGEAIADRFPRFSIAASQAVSGTPSFERLVGEAIAGAIAPIFDAGQRKAEVEYRRSRVEEEIGRYTGDFLAAVRDVEVAMARESRIGERNRRQEAQLVTARKLLTESKNRYRLGATDYLPVIDAVSKLQDLERTVLSSRRERLSLRVSLYRALGGPMPEPDPER